MALTFGAATSNRVDHGDTASLRSGALDPFTVAIWAFVTTRTSLRSFAGKGTNGFRFGLNGTTGNFELVVARATTSADYISNDTPVAANTWVFLAATFDSGAGSTVHLYHGTLTSSAVESTYGTSTNGVGARSDDTGTNFGVGNVQGSGAPVLAIQGRVAWAGVWNRALSLGELKDQQFRPHVTSGCKLFCHEGWNGTGTQPDWSGLVNNGTVTGATVGAHVPLGFLLPGARELPDVVTTTGVKFRRSLKQRVGSR